MSKANLRILTHVLCGVMIFWGLLFWNFCQSNGLRLTSHRLNVKIEEFAGFLPIIVLVALLIAPFSRMKWWLIAVFVPIAPIILFGAWVGSGLESTPILLQSIPTSDGQVRVYREHGFLEIDPDDKGPLTIRHETTLLPHLIWVRLLVTNKADDFLAKRVDGQHLLCTFSNRYADFKGQPNPRRVLLDVR